MAGHAAAAAGVSLWLLKVRKRREVHKFTRLLLSGKSKTVLSLSAEKPDMFMAVLAPVAEAW